MGRAKIKHLLVAVVAFIAGCAFVPGVTGSGNLVTKQMSLGSFDKINASGAFHVEVTQGATASVEITADDNLWNSLDVRNDGGTLRLGMKDGSYNNTHVSAKVVVPQLTAMTTSGAVESSIKGFKDDHGNMDLNISGASRLDGDIEQDRVTLDVSGASRIALRGQANSMKMVLSGASHGDLDSFSSAELQANISGASSAHVKATKKLDYDVSGASHLAYSDTPAIGQADVSGASSIQ